MKRIFLVGTILFAKGLSQDVSPFKAWAASLPSCESRGPADKYCLNDDTDDGDMGHLEVLSDEGVIQ